MRILFDHQIFSQQQYGGISRYFCELVRGINQTSTHKAHLSLLWSNNVHLREYGLDIMPYYFPKRHRFLRVSNRYYNLIDSTLSNFEIYHPTYFDPFLIKTIGRKPYVVTYYDMIYEKLSNRFESLRADEDLIKRKKDICKNASGLIAISENTKKDMVEYLDVDPDRIQVIYLSSSMKVDVERLVTTTNSGRPYLLYVGNRDIYKNFIPFLVAVSPILQQYDLGLICAGGGGFNEVEHKAIKSHGVESYVEQRSITDPILAQLYSHAVAFVFPSLYEGFGIPILESMACRCPCVLSDRSSLPEIAGEAALYFNPDNVDDMRAAITKILDDKAYREDLVDRGTKRASTFTWERTVQETLSFYTNIASKRV